MSRVPKWGTGFGMVPGWLMLRRPSANAVLVYVHLAMHGWFNQGTATYEECKPSKKTLANGDPKRGYPGCGLGEQTVARALRELETLGAIVGEPRWDAKGGQLPNVYRLMFGGVAEPEPEEVRPEAVIAAQQGVSPVIPGGAITSDTGEGGSTQYPGGGIESDMGGGITSDTQSRKGFDLEPKSNNSSSSSLSSSSGFDAEWPDQEEEKQNWRDFAREIHGRRPDWSLSHIRNIVIKLAAEGRSTVMIRTAVALGAQDRPRKGHRGTETLNRLLADGCPLWAQAADRVIGEAPGDPDTGSASRRHPATCRCYGSGNVTVERPGRSDVVRKCPGMEAAA